MKLKKKLLFYSSIIFFLFICINLVCYVSIKVITQKNIYSKEYKEFKKRFRKSEFKTMYPHPYFGFGVGSNYNYKNFINSEPLFANEINQNS